MKTINEVKRAAKDIIVSAPFEVCRICPHSIGVWIASYDAIDGPTDQDHAGGDEITKLEILAQHLGFNTIREERFGVVIDWFMMEVRNG